MYVQYKHMSSRKQKRNSYTYKNIKLNEENYKKYIIQSGKKRLIVHFAKRCQYLNKVYCYIRIYTRFTD